jgi:hypothetical protein
MSKLVTGLMFSTLAFAASTFYLSYQLGVEREKNLRQADAPSSPPQRAVADSPAGPVAPGDPAIRAEQSRQLAQLLREDWRATAPQIGIAPEELDQVLARLAEQALNAAPGTPLDERIATALGPERHARYKEYRQSSDAQR